MNAAEIKSDSEFQVWIGNNQNCIVEVYKPLSDPGQLITFSFQNFEESLDDIALGKVNIKHFPNAGSLASFTASTFLFYFGGNLVDEYSGTDINIIREKTKSLITQIKNII